MTRVRLKFCGMTRTQDVLLAEELGVDAIGLIFAPSSKRFITAEQGRVLSSVLGVGVARVGVFVDAPLDALLRTAERSRLTAVQLHGAESEAYALEVARFYPVLKAHKLSTLEHLVREEGLFTTLLDGVNPGSGHALDWAVLQAHLEHSPVKTGWGLAGGLTPDNVTEALERFAPLGLGWLDAVSGLEARAGEKNPQKMRDFVARVAQYQTQYQARA